MSQIQKIRSLEKELARVRTALRAPSSYHREYLAQERRLRHQLTAEKFVGVRPRLRFRITHHVLILLGDEALYRFQQQKPVHKRPEVNQRAADFARAKEQLRSANRHSKKKVERIQFKPIVRLGDVFPK